MTQTLPTSPISSSTTLSVYQAPDTLAYSIILKNTKLLGIGKTGYPYAKE